MTRRLVFAIFTILIIVALTTGIIALGRGYRLNWKTGSVQPTGLLLAKSFPDGAQVYVDDHLVSATNNTISLPPGIYEVKISKDGYLPWQKKLTVRGEVVTRADALLLPVAPELRPLTSTGALNPILSLDGAKIAYGIATASAEKQGVWVNELVDRPMSFQPAARQIYKDNEYLKLSTAQYIWSPDGKQILTLMGDNYYLLSSENLNNIPQDISLTYELVLSQWSEDYRLKQETLLKTLKIPLYKFIKQNARIISWAPDETKFLYEATKSASLQPIITPPLIGTNNQPEERDVAEGKIYVYDIKEDKNFLIKEKNPNAEEVVEKNAIEKYREEINFGDLLWLSDSNHLIWIETDKDNKKKIDISEYDNTNKETVFASSFEDNYIFAFPSGPGLIILTTLNPQITIPNLYVINLR